jgi:hypothetical protein
VGALAAARWRSTVSRYFTFLESEFHMRVIATDDSSNWETSVTYGRDPIAVIVRYNVEFDRAEIELVQLIDHQVPKVPIFVHQDTPTNRALLDLLLVVRAPTEAEQLKALTGLSKGAIERALSFQAAALQRYGRDFLDGDTSVFADIDRLIKARVPKDPQVLRIHVPEGTSQAEIDKTVAQARKVDPRVPIEVGFYRRPTTLKRPPRKWPWQRRGRDSDA